MAEIQALFGRDRELAALREAYQHIATGASQARTVVVTGVAGIGKTSLCAAVAAEFEAAGALVLGGACPRPSGVQMAYAPFVAAWRAAPGGGFVDLLTGLVALGDVPAEVSRAWVCDRVLAQLSSWCQRAPVVLLVEDAHWIDPASLCLLQTIARAGGRRRLLILVSARTDAVEPVPGATASLLELATRPTDRHVPLGPLPDTAVRTLVVSVSGGDDPGVDSVVRRAEGHPLFARELAAHPGPGLPGSLRVLLGQRVREIGQDGMRLLAAVALAGDDGSEPLLGNRPAEHGRARGQDSDRPAHQGSAVGRAARRPAGVPAGAALAAGRAGRGAGSGHGARQGREGARLHRVERRDHRAGQPVRASAVYLALRPEIVPRGGMPDAA